MFHFPAFPPHALCIQAWVTGHDSCRVSPFGHPRITARLAAPRGLSQPPTSFIGSWCQGIHRAPLLTWPQRCSRPLCSSQGTGGPDRLYRRVRPPHRSVRAAVRRASGPRELRSLRTQQRAYGRGAFRLPVPTSEEAVLGSRHDATAELVSVPPMSTRPACTSGTGSGRSRGIARCSLERR
jgi:hypothetical protein